MRALRRTCITTLVLMLLLQIPIFAPSASATLSEDVCVQVNGTVLSCEPGPCIVDGTAYVPLRTLTEALCAGQVLWDNSIRSAFVLTDGLTMYLTEGMRYLTVNGRTRFMPGSMFLRGGKTMIPIRSLAEALGAVITWDNDTRTVSVTGANPAPQEDVPAIPDTPVETSPVAETSYVDDLFWLARIIYAESGGEPLEGQIAVGNVVLNRLASPSYPNTMIDVIFDSTNGIQFEPVSNGTIFNTPSEKSYTAARMAMAGESIAGDCLFFFNPSLSPGTWIVENRTYAMTIGSHDFYL